MKALVLSGGASKGAFTAGVVKYLLRDKGMEFDMAVGNSTGSLIGGPAMLGDYNYLSDIYTRVKDIDIFRNSFIGNISKFLHIQDTPINATMEPLHKLLKEYYIKDRKLKQLLDTGKYFAVALVNVYSGQVHFISTRHVAEKKIKPTTFIKAVLASCCEPVFTQPIQVFEEEKSKFKNDLFYDGGVKEFIPLEHAVVSGATSIWAISTSTFTNSETHWGRNTKPDQVNILKALLWTIGAILDEVARGDRYRADSYFKLDKVKKEIAEKAHGFGLTDEQINQILTAFKKITPKGESLLELRVIRPAKPMSTGLTFDPEIMLQHLADGELAAEKFFQDGAPIYTDNTLAPWIHSVDYV
ncbi:MAG: patatin-like phospholipase family protein [bacterium]